MNKKNNILEHTIKTHSHEIFASGEPKDGHRERFARRLEALHAETISEVETDTHVTHEAKANNGRNRVLACPYRSSHNGCRRDDRLLAVHFTTGDDRTDLTGRLAGRCAKPLCHAV